MMWAWPIWSSGLIPDLRISYCFVLETDTRLGDNTSSLPQGWRLMDPAQMRCEHH